VDGEELVARFKQIGAASLLARHYSRQGGRHEGGLVIGGFLARCGFNAAQANLFAEAVCVASLQPPDKRRDIIRACKDSVEAFASGRDAFGKPKMVEVFGESVTKKCVELLGYRADARPACEQPSREESSGIADSFVRGDGGQILRGHPHNVEHAIARLGVVLKHNEFSTYDEIGGLEGYGPELNQAGAIRLKLNIHEAFGFLLSRELFEEVITDAAYRNRYHPVRDWLDSLKWDHKPRIGNWLNYYAGTAESELNRAIGRIFFIAGVRRVRQPGCKFDTLLVLESPQGRDKSKALRVLAIRSEWFTDNLPLSADTKEVIEQMAGVWIAEFAELSGIGKRDVAHVKNFLSKQDDRARRAYGREIAQFNYEALEHDVEQLWAEAVFYEAQGESIVLQQDLWDAARAAQADREIDNPIRDLLVSKLGGAPGWVSAATVWSFFDVSIDRRQVLSTPVGRAMKSLGFKRMQCGVDDDPAGQKRGERYYVRGATEEEKTTKLRRF